MVDETDFFGDTAPGIGEQLVVPVMQAATRTTFFPDQVVVLTSPNLVELILLRQETVIRSHTGTVTEKRDGQIELTFSPHVSQETTDVGHIRLNLPRALDLAITILGQAILSQGVDLELVIQRLQSSVEQAK